MTAGDHGFQPAGPEDAETISTLALAIWQQTYRPAVLTEAELDYFFRRLYLPGRLREDMARGEIFERIMAGERLIGFLSHKAEPEHARLRLCKLYLAPEFQGRGIGAEALLRVKAAAEAQGFGQIALYVFRKNERAIRTYLRAGFEVVRADCSDTGDGFFWDDYEMVWRLAPEAGEGG